MYLFMPMLGINLSQILETCIERHLSLIFLLQPVIVSLYISVPLLIKTSAIEFRAQSNQRVALVNYQNSLTQLLLPVTFLVR